MSVESPCIRICQIQNGICVGCKRTLAELTDWYKLSDQQKLEILNNIKTRA